MVRRAIDFAFDAERGGAGPLLRARAALRRRDVQQHGQLGARPNRLREHRPVPHDLGRVLRALGPRAGRADPRPLRRRRAAHPRQRPPSAGGGLLDPRRSRRSDGRRQGLPAGLRRGRQRCAPGPATCRCRFWPISPSSSSELDRHDLPGGILYEVQNVPDVAAANRVHGEGPGVSGVGMCLDAPDGSQVQSTYGRGSGLLSKSPSWQSSAFKRDIAIPHCLKLHGIPTLRALAPQGVPFSPYVDSLLLAHCGHSRLALAIRSSLEDHECCRILGIGSTGKLPFVHELHCCNPRQSNDAHFVATLAVIGAHAAAIWRRKRNVTRGSTTTTTMPTLALSSSVMA